MRQKSNVFGRWERPRSFLLCAAWSMAAAPAITAAATQAECDSAWQAMSDEPGSDASLTHWKSFEDKCKGTGVYEIRLASIYGDREEFELARQALLSAEMPDNMRRHADVAAITIDYLQAVSSGDRAQLAKVEESAAAFAKVNAKAMAVLSMLAHSRVLLGEFEQAIAPLETVIRAGEGNLGDHRNLTIAYASTGRYSLALAMLDKTYAIDKAITSDEEFMYAATLAYAASGEVAAAKSMLTLIANKKPQLLNDPKYQQTILKAKELSQGKLE